MASYEEIATAVEAGNIKGITELVLRAVDDGLNPMDILNKGMISAMQVIGERFSRGEAFVPEMLISARTMKKGVEALKPYLSAGGATTRGKVIIGTVHGDIHDIGKNLVAMMIESSGFEVIDLGIDVPAERFIESIRSNADVCVVALSTLLTTTMPAMRSIVGEINALETRKNFRVLVGGAPISDEFASQIGADGFAPNAAAAAKLVKSYVASSGAATA